MSKNPMIPPQPADQRDEPQRFNDFAKRLLAVPKPEIDAQEKRETPKPKQPKKK